MWAAAEWMAKTGRKEADAIAGEEILFKNEKSKASEVEGMVPPTQKVVAPLFNIVSSVTRYPGNPRLTHDVGGRLEFDTR